MSFPMPSHVPFDDAAYRFQEGHSVTLYLAHDAGRMLSASEGYILTTSCSWLEIDNDEEVYKFDPERWPEVVRLLVLSETDTLLAVFEAWVQWDDSNAVPDCVQCLDNRQTEIKFGQLSQPARRHVLEKALRPHLSPDLWQKPIHGPEGSDA